MGLKLHLGCGNDIKPGYINVDEFSAGAQLRAAIQDLDFPDNSVECIEAYMVLEHLSPENASRFANNAYRMLEDNGRLTLECPDLEKVARLILAFADDPAELDEGPFGLRGIFGEPTPAMTIGDYHKWGYTPSSATRLLENAGFRRIVVSDGTSHGMPIRDMRIEALK